MSRLLTLHGIAAGLHFAQSGALTYLVTKDSKDAPLWPITRLGWKKVVDTKEFYLGTLVPIFPFLSGVNHLAAVVSPSWYKGVLDSKVNWLRWAEYSLSAGVMTFIISILSGVTEVRTLVSLMILNAAMQMMGLLIEKRKAKNAPLSEMIALFGVAWGIFAAIWSQIVISFMTVIGEDDVKPPAIVYSIIYMMLGLFSSFGVAQLLYCADVMSFETYEMTFIGLSLAAKSSLSWMVYGGVLAADARFEEN